MKEENNSKNVDIDGTNKSGSWRQENGAGLSDVQNQARDAQAAESISGSLRSAESEKIEIADDKSDVKNIFSIVDDKSGDSGADGAGMAAEGAGVSDAIELEADEKRKKKGSEAMAWIRDILIAVLIAVIIAQFIQPTIVREHSMQETLQPNDYLILSKMSYKFGDIQYGDIVVFKSNVETEDGKKKLLIKRVIAKGGDTIAIADGQVYRNGEILDEPYTKDGYTNGGLDEVTVPEGELFLMGDNRVVSVDSRSPEVGFVSEDLVIGKAIVRLFPFNQIGSVYKNLPDDVDGDGKTS